jgi:zinc protease
MWNYKVIQKKILQIHSLFLVGIIGLCSFVFSVSSFADVAPKVIEAPQIERVIPSKATDLFVVLKNGLTALIRENPSSDVVACQILVKTGSIYEGDRMGGGLSHYLEHVVTGGTTSRHTEDEIKQEIQAMGGASNAYTSYDQTGYYINTTKDHYKDALSLLLETVTGCQFNETEYLREKPVILQEFQLGENDPGRILWYLFMKTAYQRHPVRIPVIGEKDIFLAMDKEDLMAHYRRWYSPPNLVITVVGNVDKEEVLSKVLSAAGSLKAGPQPPYFLPDEPGQLSERIVEKSSPIAKLTRVMMGFRTIPLTDPDLYPLDVLAVILGDGRTSELYRKVKDEKQLVLSISASSWTPSFVDGQFFISMNLDYENLDSAIEANWSVLEEIQEKGVDDEALNRAKKKVAADHIFSNQSTANQGRQLASDWTAAGDPYFSDTYVERIQSVTAEDCQRVAKKYFKRQYMTMAVLKPASSASLEASTEINAQHKEGEGTVTKSRLSNGMTLLLKNNPSVPIVTLQFFAKGGLRFEPPDASGVSRFMASLLTKGTQTRTKHEIAKSLEDLGGSISAGSGSNTVFVEASVLKEDFDTGLEILADVVLHPSFPEDEIEKQRKDTLLAIKRIDEHWIVEIQRLFRKHYYVKHPYRNDSLGTAESIQNLSQEEIIEFYQSVIMPNNAVFAIYGDIDAEEVAIKVAGAFRDFVPGMASEPLIEPETTNIAEDNMFTKTNQKTSSAIFVGYNGMTLYDEDRPVADVIDAIISGIGYPSGWLHDALRGGDQSLVYYIHAYPSYGIEGGYFGAMAQTTPSNYDNVLATIKQKFELIQNEKVSEETLERAKAMCITMHQMSLETNGAQAHSDAVNELLELGYEYDQQYPELIRKVTADDVQRVAKRLFKHSLTVTTKPEEQVPSGE